MLFNFLAFYKKVSIKFWNQGGINFWPQKWRLALAETKACLACCHWYVSVDILRALFTPNESFILPLLDKFSFLQYFRIIREPKSDSQSGYLVFNILIVWRHIGQWPNFMWAWRHFLPMPCLMKFPTDGYISWSNKNFC